MTHVRADTPFRDPALVRRLADAIADRATRAWTLMEVCGGQTHAIVRHGLDRLLPPTVSLVHGPGCPVCVTPAEVIDAAIGVARRPEVVLCTFGDMLRVPGRDGDLQRARAEGADVRVVHGPLDAVRLARAIPDRDVVFLAVGFETTAPAVAAAVHAAHEEGLSRFAVLVAHVLVPPALDAICAAPDRAVDGFLAAGHVCAVEGLGAYRPLAARHRVPVVVTGFQPVDVLAGVLACVAQLEEGRAEVENAYDRAVRDDGNPAARALVDRVFTVRDQAWRGLGTLPRSGLALRPAYAMHDAASRYGLVDVAPAGSGVCRAAEVLTGRLRPTRCEAFGGACTPSTPLGAPMVSAEGACAAYFSGGRRRGHA